MLVRFGETPEDIVFDVDSRTGFYFAFCEALTFVRPSNCRQLTCFIEAPQSLPDEWSLVPNLELQLNAMPVVIYRAWYQVQAHQRELACLSEIVDDVSRMGGFQFVEDCGKAARLRPILTLIK